MKKSPFELLCIKAGVIIFVSTFCVTSLMAGESEFVPPDQDYYLHFSQYPNFCCDGDALENGSHDFVWLWDILPEVQRRPDGSWTDALTIEAWVFWETSDLQEIQAATGLDIDRMTLLRTYLRLLGRLGCLGLQRLW